jgi:ribosomal protein S18 acetylase RimI-like enzyme
VNVRSVRPEEIDRAGLTLARSFEHDVLFAWMFGHGALRALHRSFRSQIGAQYMPSGIVETVGDLSGVALWSAPGRGVGPAPLQMLRMFPGHLHMLRPDRAMKALRGFATMDSHHPDEPHIHLAVLGVDPAHQRTGVGSLLVRSGLDRADEVGLPVYLDTSSAENVPYYRRFGFDVLVEFDFPLGGPHAWGMLRRPGAGRTS